MNRVRELRLCAGLQQKEVALAVGVARPTVSEWEHQKKDPTGERLIALAKLFNVTTAYILGYEHEQRQQERIPDDDHEVWQLREEYRRDPNRRMLFSLSNNGSAKDVRQVAAIIDVLKATNPDFYDGDDPA